MTSPQHPAPKSPVVPAVPAVTDAPDATTTDATLDDVPAAAPVAPVAPVAPLPSAPTAAPARLMAGVGMLFLFGSLVLCAAMSLGNAYGGDGVAGPIASAAYWGLLIGGFAGVVVLVSPVETMTNATRAWIVGIQYALACAAPVLVMIDG
ncbi:hypothetical protein [Streptomyces sp. NPDC047315]|uniref:hypothetical protein n=1 Tax=Streptomyces sp. NPDC047315 TaxID=3155142 RepID=UPI0034052D62